MQILAQSGPWGRGKNTRGIHERTHKLTLTANHVTSDGKATPDDTDAIVLARLFSLIHKHGAAWCVVAMEGAINLTNTLRPAPEADQPSKS